MLQIKYGYYLIMVIFTRLQIKKIIRVDAFCCKCCHGFYKASQAINHVCSCTEQNDSNTKKQINRQKKAKLTRFPKDKAHYLTRKKANWTDKDQRYIVYDVEANPRRMHIPNKVLANEYFVPSKNEVNGDSFKFYKTVTVEKIL